MIIPVILSGGSGSRLWPLSRAALPKQLLPLADEKTMLQNTIKRGAAVTNIAPILVANYAHRFLIEEQLAALNLATSSILLEPVGKNTAPAATLAALQALAQYPDEDPLLLLMPADHVVLNPAAFQQAVKRAEPLAQQGYLITFGIKPDQPETNYGYIEQGDAVADGAFHVSAFKEKPDANTAEQYLATGKYHWNSGIFLFSAKSFLAEMTKFQSEMLQATRQAFATHFQDLAFINFDQNAFNAIPADSIDYAVMEQTDKALVIPVDMSWSDVGSWASLAAVMPADDDGNVVQGDVLLQDCHDCYVRSEKKLVTAIGMANHVIVETDDAILVANKNQDQAVKDIVSLLKAQNRSEATKHSKIYRPWGWFQILINMPGFKVNHICMKPSQRIRTQRHQHRTEHWVVLSGRAAIEKDGVQSYLGVNESSFIPSGMKHTLANAHDDQVLEVIEVQTGQYFGEDDIERF